MPTRARSERQEAVQAERVGIPNANVCLVLKPDFTCFKVSKAELRKEMWGRTVSSSIPDARPILFLEGFHPAIFAFFALYLNHLPLFPFIDLGFRFKGYDSAMRVKSFVQSDEIPMITMGLLANDTNDRQPHTMSPARRLIFAYLMGQRLGLPHFQDAIMNVIVKFFLAERSPSPAFIAWLYNNCAAGRPSGLKRFFIDFYNWVLSVHADKMTPLHDYTPAFRQDVELASEATKKMVVIDAKDSQERTEQSDVIIDFKQLQAVLCNGRQGRLKCRYHQHNSEQLCFNLIV